MVLNGLVASATLAYVILGVLLRTRLWRPEFYRNYWKNVGEEPLRLMCVTMLAIDGVVALVAAGFNGLHSNVTTALSVQTVLIWYMIAGHTVQVVRKCAAGSGGRAPGEGYAVRFMGLKLTRAAASFYLWAGVCGVATAILAARFAVVGVPGI